MKSQSIIVISLLAVLLVSPIAFAAEQDKPIGTHKIGISRDIPDTPDQLITKPASFLSFFLAITGLKTAYSTNENLEFKDTLTPFPTLVCKQTSAVNEFYVNKNPYAANPYAKQAVSVIVDGSGKAIEANWKYDAGEFIPNTYSVQGYFVCSDNLDVLCKNNLPANKYTVLHTVGTLTGGNAGAGIIALDKLGVSKDNVCRVALTHPDLAPVITPFDEKDFSVSFPNAPICSSEICGNGKDDDCDGAIDSEDKGANCGQTCKPQAYQACKDENVWYFNSCKSPEKVSQDCKTQGLRCIDEPDGAVCEDKPKGEGDKTKTDETITPPTGTSTTEEGKTGLVGQEGNPDDPEKDKPAKAGDPDIDVLDTKIEVKDKQVIGTIKLKNTGKAMTIPFLVEMQVPEQTGTFLAFAVPAEQKTCDAKHPENVHQTFKLDAGEETTLTLVSPQAGVLNDGFYKAGFYLRTVCWNTEFPNDARQVVGTKRGLYGFEQGLKVGTPTAEQEQQKKTGEDIAKGVPIAMLIAIISGILIVAIGTYVYFKGRRYG